MCGRGWNAGRGLALALLSAACSSRADSDCPVPKGAPVALAHSRYAEPHPWLSWPNPAAEPVLFWARGTTGDSAIHAAFFDAAGRLSGETVISESAGYNTGARSAWSAAGPALVWKRRPAGAEFEVLFRRIADRLAPEPGGDVLVSTAPATATASDLSLVALTNDEFYVGWVDETAGAMGRVVGVGGPVAEPIAVGGTEPRQATLLGSELVLSSASSSGVRVTRLTTTLEPLQEQLIEVTGGAPFNVRAAAHDTRLGLAWNGASGVQFAELDASGRLQCGPVVIAEAALVGDLVGFGSGYVLSMQTETAPDSTAGDVLLLRIPADCGPPSPARVVAEDVVGPRASRLALSSAGHAVVWETQAYEVHGRILGPEACE